MDLSYLGLAVIVAVVSSLLASQRNTRLIIWEKKYQTYTKASMGLENLLDGVESGNNIIIEKAEKEIAESLSFQGGLMNNMAVDIMCNYPQYKNKSSHNKIIFLEDLISEFTEEAQNDLKDFIPFSDRKYFPVFVEWWRDFLFVLKLDVYPLPFSEFRTAKTSDPNFKEKYKRIYYVGCAEYELVKYRIHIVITLIIFNLVLYFIIN